MMLFTFLAATFTFSATATGVEKGAPVEFFLAGKGSDRDYETMFLLDGSADDFCRQIEAAGIRRGKPENTQSCNLWPVGCKVEMKPSFSDFVEIRLPEGIESAPIVYTGGNRLPDGTCEAATNMPFSVLSFYSLGQSPLVFATPHDQSVVYNCFQAKRKLPKGTRVEFKLSWDEKSMPKPLSYVIRPGNATDVIKSLKTASSEREIDVMVDFDPDLTVAEAKTAANALSVIDSHQVKINGFAEGHLYYRAFLPLVKWLDRQERLVQPFELTIGPTNKLVYVESDWKVEGLDPRLIPHEISSEEAKNHRDVTTCFIYAKPDCKLNQIYSAIQGLKNTAIRTWYVFVQ